MKRIIIKNFGPVKYFDMEIKKINILIGPQASGKSTIVKSIYFMDRIRRLTLKMIQDMKGEEDVFHFLRNLNKRIRKEFVLAFGTTRHMERFEITAYFNDKNFIQLFLDNERWVKIYYSESFVKTIDSLKKLFKKYVSLKLKLLENPFDEKSRNKSFFILTNIYKEINSFFDDVNNSLFIPAGRSVISILGDNILELKDKIDLFLKEYIEEISNIKEFFNMSIEDLVENRKKLSNEKIDFRKISIASDLIKKILKGYYVYDKEEKLFFDKNKYVKLNLASSGQQEALWILNIVFIYLLFNRKSNLIIEEPEAHLFPNAQKDIVKLVSLYSNISNNKVFITTHSPYILASFNNLIFAGNIYSNGKKVPFIEKDISINFNDVNAFMISLKENYSILDEEIKQIKSEEIDQVSEILNKEYEKLLNLELKNE